MFNGLEKAAFLRRPNRFVVECADASGGVTRAFLPNPGRLWELLLPGAVIYLARGGDGKAGRGVARKTAHTAVAVERDGRPVFLHTHHTNTVAEDLIRQGRIPGLADAEIAAREVTVGDSRFDFLLRQDGQERLAEVKSVTLFGNGVAMFPDAVTARGKRHLEELTALAEQGERPVVLFVIHHPDMQWFMPDYHTDLAFSRTLLEARHAVEILPVAVSYTPDLQPDGVARAVAAPWAHIARECVDRGVYLAMAHAPEDGDAGERLGFPAGYYMLFGEDQTDLSAAIRAFSAKRKRPFSPFHALWARASWRHVLPIRGADIRLDFVADALTRTCPEVAPADAPPGCPGPLFFSRECPLHSPAFHAFLQDMRMRPPRDSA